jgi:hypothetical protein
MYRRINSIMASDWIAHWETGFEEEPENKFNIRMDAWKTGSEYID